MTWLAILTGAAGCYLLKLGGLSVPPRLLSGERLRQVAELVPVGLLSALVATQALATGTRLHPDARLAGLAVALVAVVRRAPFLVVVALAAVTTATVRLAG